MIWSSRLNTSGCAFSISSSSTTAYGRRRMLLGELAAFLVADVAGRRPIRRLTLCFSMYSDMSIWMRASSSPNMNSARRLASNVLPTPVGPTKMNDADRPLRILAARCGRGGAPSRSP